MLLIIRGRKIRHLNEQDLQTLLQSDENYYKSKRAITQSFQNFLRILIVAFLGAFIAQTPWSSLNFPILAYIGTGSLIIAAIINIFAFRVAHNALDEYRNAIHKTYDENNTVYIEETPKLYKIQEILSNSLLFFLILSIVICPASYIVEKTHGPKEVTQMAKKQQSTQQPSRNTGREKNERLWDTPARPITPTPATAPSNTSAPPAQPPAQPEQQPAQPEQTPAQQPSTGKK